MSRLILITGGARSGKSDFAEQLAHSLGRDDVLFVATAEALDEDMARRIAAHRQSRPPAWCTLETPRHVGTAIQNAAAARVVIVDCLTLLVSNVLFAEEGSPDPNAAETAVSAEVCDLIAAARAVRGDLIVVTNEVGLGIVPDNRLARTYRDLLGRANSTLAREADQVYLMVAGLPLEIKALTRR